MPLASLRGRVAAALVVAALGAVPLLPASAAPIDPIGDKQAQARQIAAQLDQLQHQAEAYTEQYNAAQVHLQEVQAKVAAASQRVKTANAEMTIRRKEVTKYAVGSYVRGGNAGVLPVLLKSDGSDMGRRQGYVNAAVGDRQELLNALSAARDDAQHEIGVLDDAKAKAQQAKDDLDQKRHDTEAAVAKTQSLNQQVQGELADLVRQEQQRRAAEEQRRAELRARQQAEAQRQAAPPPAPPTVATTAPGTTAPGTTAPSTTAPGTTAPGTTVPGTTVPGTTVPGTTVPGTTVPGTTAAGTTAAGTTAAGTTAAGTTAAGTTAAGTTAGTTSPGTTAPGTTAGTTSPGTTAPGTTAPSTTAPSTTAPSTTAPSTSRSTTTTSTTEAPRATEPARAPRPTGNSGGDGENQAPAPSPGPSGGGGGGGGGVVAAARSVLGTPYVFGGASRGGFDCSGLVQWAFAQSGRSVPRTATAQMHASRRISLSELQPGDLVFYNGDSSYIDHIAIYEGGGMVIHAPHTGSYVKEDSLYFWDAIVGAGRL